MILTNDMAELSFANAAPSVERSDLDAAADAVRTALAAAGRGEHESRHNANADADRRAASAK